MSDQRLTRRAVVGAGIGASLGAGLLLRLTPPALAAGETELPPTPACGDDHAPTRRQTEGPYFTPRSPLRADFSADGRGEAIVLAGFVLTRDCRPVPDALVDLWHADAAGRYDNAGYRYRGHQFTDARGRWRFLTVIPGLYPGRTRHYHVKVQASGGPVLTTQFYFPDEPANRRDGLYDPTLRMRISGDGAVRLARYDIVLASA